ncbi:MAG: hypothetical protein RIA08_18610 [Roseovarius sp.]|uniref:hypothetical protein n=1 Tax=Roseovarius sp. TaxID=1486281 RepID=UPI0032EB0D62
MFRWRQNRERRRLDIVYDNPRAARPRPVQHPWTRHGYLRRVLREAAGKLCILALLLIALLAARGMS